MTGTPSDQRLIRVAFQEGNDDLVANLGDDDTAVAACLGKRGFSSWPTRGLGLDLSTARRGNNLTAMIRLAAKICRGAAIMMGVAGTFDNGRTAAGFIPHPRYGLALYLRGRTGGDFGSAVAMDGATVQVAFTSYGFHRQISHWPSRWMK